AVAIETFIPGEDIDAIHAGRPGCVDRDRRILADRRATRRRGDLAGRRSAERGIVIHADDGAVPAPLTPVEVVAGLRPWRRLENVLAFDEVIERHVDDDVELLRIALAVRRRAPKLGDLDPVVAVEAEPLVRRPGVSAPEIDEDLRANRSVEVIDRDRKRRVRKE